MNIFYYFFLFSILFKCHSIFSQITNNEGHEDWEYALESSGDILQLALTIGA
ncbi:MAG: hypothetical protein ACWA45_01770 [Flavobacteriales bacterium]